MIRRVGRGGVKRTGRQAGAAGASFGATGNRAKASGPACMQHAIAQLRASFAQNPQQVAACRGAGRATHMRLPVVAT
jgi:hypothetical protein